MNKKQILFNVVFALTLVFIMASAVYIGKYIKSERQVRETERLRELINTEGEVKSWETKEGVVKRDCVLLSDDWEKDSCYASRAWKQAPKSPRTAIELCQNVKKHERRIGCLNKVSNITGNTISSCELKKDVTEKNTCLRDNAITAAETDPVEAETQCDLIMNQLRRDWCYIEISASIVGYNHREAASVCDRIFGEYQKTECLMNVAEILAKTSDRDWGLAYCEIIQVIDSRNYCKAKVMYLTGVTKARRYCDRITDEREKDSCIIYVGGRRK